VITVLRVNVVSAGYNTYVEGVVKKLRHENRDSVDDNDGFGYKIIRKEE
jgi:hypothetical protein